MTRFRFASIGRNVSAREARSRIHKKRESIKIIIIKSRCVSTKRRPSKERLSEDKKMDAHPRAKRKTKEERGRWRGKWKTIGAPDGGAGRRMCGIESRGGGGSVATPVVRSHSALRFWRFRHRSWVCRIIPVCEMAFARLGMDFFFCRFFFRRHYSFHLAIMAIVLSVTLLCRASLGVSSFGGNATHLFLWQVSMSPSIARVGAVWRRCRADLGDSKLI